MVGHSPSPSPLDLLQQRLFFCHQGSLGCNRANACTLLDWKAGEKSKANPERLPFHLWHNLNLHLETAIGRRESDALPRSLVLHWIMWEEGSLQRSQAAKGPSLPVDGFLLFLWACMHSFCFQSPAWPLSIAFFPPCNHLKLLGSFFPNAARCHLLPTPLPLPLRVPIAFLNWCPIHSTHLVTFGDSPPPMNNLLLDTCSKVRRAHLLS